MNLSNLLVQSTGSPKETYKKLKIKDNVDHAGLSPLLLLVNPLTLSSDHNLEISLNNNSLIVLDLMEITDVQEV